MNKLRDIIRMLGIPAAILVLALNILPVTLGDDSIGDGPMGMITFTTSALLLTIVIVSASFDFRQQGGDNGRRWIGLFRDISIVLSYAALPLTGLYVLSMGLGGLNTLGLLVICILASGCFSLVGLVLSMVSAATGRYASGAAAWSSILTASMFTSLALAIFVQPIAAFLLAVSGMILLIAITLGCVALFNGPVLTSPGGISGVPAWETQSHRQT